MLKNRHTISSIKVNKRSLRPTSSSTYQPKPTRSSVQINHIISSLEHNVKDLKTYYRRPQQPKGHTQSITKNRNHVRLRKVLRRDSSQANLRPQQQHKQPREDIPQNDKTLADIFEIRSYFLKVTGRETNNIVELYQFYKKNIEKREKSTRILASIDLSNPNMGLSLDVGKQSLLKHQMLNYRDRKEIKEQSSQNQKLEGLDRYEYSSRLERTSQMQKEKKNHEKASTLAVDLLSKGLYNIANVANLMQNKKYKLTKEKEQSFQLAKEKRSKLISLKLEPSKQNNPAVINVEKDHEIHKKLNEMKNILQKQKVAEMKSNEQSKSSDLNKNFSFYEAVIIKEPEQSLSKSRNSNKREKTSESKPFEVSSIKKVIEGSPKLQEISGLEESPIVPAKGKDFIRSKYYVQPIPLANKRPFEQQQSISLQSNSKIIDMDLLPFEL